MADPISFDPFLGWVNIPDPNNIPEDARTIGADDLLRYENWGKDGSQRLNEMPDLIAAEIANPETPLSGSVQDIVDSALTGFTPAAAMMIVNAGSSLDTPRPAGFTGRVLWLVLPPGGIPTYLVPGDMLVISNPATLVIASDDFNRANASLATTPIGALSYATAHSASSTPVAAVFSNEAKFTTGLTGGTSFCFVNPGSVAYAYQIKVASMDATFASQVILEWTDRDNYMVLARVSSTVGTWRVVKRVAGVTTEVAITAIAMASGDVVRREIVGGQMRVFVNGVLAWSGAPAVNGTRVGFGLGTATTDAANNCRFDDLAITQIAVA